MPPGSIPMIISCLLSRVVGAYLGATRSAELAVPEAGDLDVLGRLGAQVCV